MRKLLIVLVFILLGAILVYLYIFHKPHRDIVGEKASLEISANTLIEHYEQSTDSANAVYLDQVVLLEGEVVEVDSASITMAPGVFCHLHSEADISSIKSGDVVKVKGRVVGFDDLFGEVRMDNCKLVK